MFAFSSDSYVEILMDQCGGMSGWGLWSGRWSPLDGTNALILIQSDRIEFASSLCSLDHVIQQEGNCPALDLQHFFFLPHHVACGIVVPRPEIEPVPLALES